MTNIEVECSIKPIDTPPGRYGDFSEAKLYDSSGFAVMPLSTFYIKHTLTGPIVEFVLVPDQCRNKGYATKLLYFCLEQHPDLQFSEATNEAGQALVEKFKKIITEVRNDRN